MTKLRFLVVVQIGLALGLMTAPPAAAQVEQLIGALTSNLGVTETQAEAGSGAIFGLAQERMAPDEFASLSGSVPGIEELIGAAQVAGIDIGGIGGAEATGGLSDHEPAAGGGLGFSSDLEDAAGDLMGSTGEVAGIGDLGGLAALAGPFSELGLSPEMAAEFLPIVLDYVGNTGGSPAMGLLQGALLGG